MTSVFRSSHDCPLKSGWSAVFVILPNPTLRCSFRQAIRVLFELIPGACLKKVGDEQIIRSRRKRIVVNSVIADIMLNQQLSPFQPFRIIAGDLIPSNPDLLRSAPLPVVSAN